MALIKCRDCGREVSKQADKCPNCGAPVKKKTSGCAMLFAIVAGLALVGYIASLTSGGGLTPRPSPRPSAQEEKAQREWYQGGTLHGATMREWRSAGYENRLATSADFVTKLLQTDKRPVPPLEDLKPIAEDFERGMSQVASEPASADQSAASAAASIWVLMHK